jgi:hypothetical protein
MKTCKAVGEVGSKMGVSLVEFGAVFILQKRTAFGMIRRPPSQAVPFPKK